MATDWKADFYCELEEKHSSKCVMHMHKEEADASVVVKIRLVLILTVYWCFL